MRLTNEKPTSDNKKVAHISDANTLILSQWESFN